MTVLARRLRSVSNAIAIVSALSTGIDVIFNLSRCRIAHQEQIEIHTARIEEIVRRDPWNRVHRPEDVVKDRERMYFHALMRQKYEAASLRPWIHVPPDPAPPP
jgi:hypothetical protein